MTTIVANLGVTPERADNALRIVQHAMGAHDKPDEWAFTLCNFSEVEGNLWLDKAESLIEGRALHASVYAIVPRSVTWRWCLLADVAQSTDRDALWANIDDDCEPHRDWISVLRRGAEQYPDSLLCTRGYPVVAKLEGKDTVVQIGAASTLAVPEHVLLDCHEDPIYQEYMDGRVGSSDELFFSYWAWKSGRAIVRLHAHFSARTIEPYSSHPDSQHVARARTRALIAEDIARQTGWPVPRTRDTDFTAICDPKTFRPEPPPERPWYCTSFAPSHAARFAQAVEAAFGHECVSVLRPSQVPEGHYLIALLVHPAVAYSAAPDSCLGEYQRWVDEYRERARVLQTAIMIRDERLLPGTDEIAALTRKEARSWLESLTSKLHVPAQLWQTTAKIAHQNGFVSKQEYLALERGQG